MKGFVLLFAVAGLVAILAEGASAAPRVIERHKSWAAVQDGKQGNRMCYAFAEPVRKRGRYTSRGRTFVEVVHVPAEERANEVVFVAGYTHERDSGVRVQIDGRNFHLLTDNDVAWTSGPDADRTLVRAMRKGRRMVVHGRSSRGTLTTDTYSLMGFTAAYAAASAACNVRFR